MFVHLSSVMSCHCLCPRTDSSSDAISHLHSQKQHDVSQTKLFHVFVCFCTVASKNNNRALYCTEQKPKHSLMLDVILHWLKEAELELYSVMHTYMCKKNSSIQSLLSTVDSMDVCLTTKLLFPVAFKTPDQFVPVHSCSVDSAVF